MLNCLLLTKRSSSCFFLVLYYSDEMRLKSKIMRCNKFSSPLCLSVKNIRPWQFFKKNVRPWQFSVGVHVVGHFEAARPGLCCSALSSTQCSPLYPANTFLIFPLFKLEFAYKNERIWTLMRLKNWPEPSLQRLFLLFQAHFHALLWKPESICAHSVDW